MRGKMYLSIIILIVLISIFITYQYGGYFQKPEDSLLKSKSKSINSIIDTIWVNNQEPVTFYLSKDNDVIAVRYKSKEINTSIGWRPYMFTIITYKNIISTDNVLGYYASAGKKEDNNKVLFGVSKSSKIDTVKINNNKLKLKQIKIEDEKYILWYVSAPYDLYNLNITLD